MSLVKPIINEIAAFDATVGTTITFSANGGDQVTKNELKIVLNDGEQEETVVYQNTITTFAFEHTIPANSGLSNGDYYRASIRTYDAAGNTSVWSNSQPFYCYKTPILLFNIKDGQTIRNQNCHIELTYRQIQNEKVDYALINVYNAYNVLISSSGNLYNTDYPPLTFTHDVFGLTNHSQYYIKGIVVTVNGTTIQTDNILFYTDYSTIIDEKVYLTATLNSCDGYVNLHSNIIGNIKGISNPDPIGFIGGSMVDIRNATADLDIPRYAHWVKFVGNQIFTIPTSFLLRTWFYPARQPFEVLRLTNDNGTTYVKVIFRRDATTDYLCIRSDNGTVKDISLGQLCNGNTKIFLWIKIVDSTWEVLFEILGNTPTVIEWESRNNTIQYNVTSDITYINESYETYTPSSITNFEPLSDEITNVILGNGVFDHLNVTKDTSISYTNVIPVYDEENTILDIDFNDNLINAGGINYTKLVLKRKDETLLNWMNLSEIYTPDYNVPYYINFNDSFIPTGIEQEYALVVYIDNVPSEYHTQFITPNWSKYFLSDKDNKFVLNYAVLYSGHVQNIQNGTFMPIGATYPIIVQNGEGNYRSGSLQFKLLGYQYEIDKRLDRVSMTKQLDDMLKFLTNGKAKCLTDFNGNIFIIKVINSPQISYDGNWGNNIPTVSFDWVEQGKYNNYDDMMNLGLFDRIAADE